MATKNIHNKWCIWTCEGEKQEVYAMERHLDGPYTESVNTDTQGWLDLPVVLFDTEADAFAFDTYWNLDGYITRVGDFLKEHGAL
jgi:hypothetical protein